MSFMEAANFLTISAALVLVILGILLQRVLSRGSILKKSKVVIFGPSLSGKSFLFSKLRDGKDRETYSSLCVNQDDIQLKSPVTGKTITTKVVDVPGHQEFRQEAMKHYKDASVVLFLVDSVNEMSTNQSAALLYDVLIHPNINKQKVKVIICFTKSDMETSKSKETLAKFLESELEKIKKSRASNIGVEGMHDSDDTIVLGYDDEPFIFDHLQIDVCMESVSAKRDINKIIKLIVD